MAETAEKFRESERRKMRLQAMLSAKRASLMTMGPPGFPLDESNPHRQVQFVPTAPFDKPIIGGSAAVPGRAEADASIRQNQTNRFLNPGVNLNAENAKRIEGQVAFNNAMRPSRIRNENARRQQVAAQQAAQQFVSSPYQRQPQTRTNPDARSVNPHGKGGYIGSMNVNHWTGQATSGAGWGHGTALSDQWVPGQEGIDFIENENLLRGYEYPSDKPTYGGAGRPGVVEPGVAPPLAQPVAQRAPQSSYGPGLTPAAAEERYGPGGMYGTQPLAGGLSDQQGMTGSMGVASPQKPIKSGSEHLVDNIKWIAKRKAIIAGSAAFFGSASDGRKAGERYEAEALASLGIYAGKYALSNLDDSDFQSSQKLFQGLLKSGLMPLDQILKVVDSGVANEAGAPELKQIREGSDYVTYQVYPDGSMEEFSRSPIASGKADTNVNITMPGSDKAGEAFGKGLGEKVSAVLGGGEDDLFEKLRKDNIQIGPLIDAVESGQVQTGKGQEFFKNFKGVLGQFLPDSKTKDLFNKSAGMEEWWKSTVDSFVGLKLAMTKGAISDKEMKLFMDMIPSLSKTEEGNKRLLRLMRSLNNIVLAQEAGTLDYIKNLAERGEDIGSESTAQQTVDWYKFLDVRKNAAIKDFHRVANGYPDARDEAYLTLRDDKALKQQTDAQINEHLDKYYPKVSADG